MIHVLWALWSKETGLVLISLLTINHSFYYNNLKNKNRFLFMFVSEMVKGRPQWKVQTANEEWIHPNKLWDLPSREGFPICPHLDKGMFCWNSYCTGYTLSNFNRISDSLSNLQASGHLAFLCSFFFLGHCNEQSLVQTGWQVFPAQGLFKLWVFQVGLTNQKLCNDVYFLYFFHNLHNYNNN